MNTTTNNMKAVQELTKKQCFEQRKRLGDEEAGRLSREVHGHHHHDGELHSEDDSSSETIKSLIFGGLDGCITAFAIVSAAEGASLEPPTILILGLANVFADALAMALGDVVSERAEQEYAKREFDREGWEFDNYREGELDEMRAIFRGKFHVEDDDCETLLTVMAKYKPLFLETMAHYELGIMPPHQGALWKKGTTTFFAFLVFGTLPLVGYVVFIPFHLGRSAMFAVSVAATALTLFALGFIQAIAISSTKSPTLSGFVILFNGGLAAAAAYLISWGAQTILHNLASSQQDASSGLAAS